MEGSRDGELLSNEDRVLVLQDEKTSVDGRWWCQPNNMNKLNVTEPDTLKMINMVIFMIYL